MLSRTYYANFNAGIIRAPLLLVKVSAVSGATSCAVCASEGECSGPLLAVQCVLVKVSAVGGATSCAVCASEGECSGWGY